MEVVEALDREVIVERAEEVRFWLLGLHLSSQATSAIQRELGAIIDNDPGTYINGQRPLAGLTVAEFITELHRPNGGAVGRVKSVGYAALNELRARIPEGSSLHYAQPEPEPDYTIPVDVVEASQQDEPPPIPVDEAKPRHSRPRRVAAPMSAVPMLVPIEAVALAAPEHVAPAAATPQAEVTSEVQPARRGPGRPKGSTKARRNGIAAAAQPSADELPAPVEPVIAAEPAIAEPIIAELPTTAEPKARRGRPRRDAAPPIVVASLFDSPTANSSAIITHVAHELPPAPAEVRIAPVAHDGDDPMLKQIARLWPALHPHARRAVVMYASALWAETATHKG